MSRAKYILSLAEATTSGRHLQKAVSVMDATDGTSRHVKHGGLTHRVARGIEHMGGTSGTKSDDHVRKAVKSLVVKGHEKAARHNAHADAAHSLSQGVSGLKKAAGAAVAGGAYLAARKVGQKARAKRKAKRESNE